MVWAFLVLILVWRWPVPGAISKWLVHIGPEAAPRAGTLPRTEGGDLNRSIPIWRLCASR
jgi:hypothetical protein